MLHPFDVVAQDADGLHIGLSAAPPIGQHHTQTHDQLTADPRRFCSPTAVVTDIDVTDPARPVLTWQPLPYCTKVAHSHNSRLGAEGWWTLGFNLTITVGDSNSRLLVARRSSQLTFGGRWHVPVNEGAEPGDLAGHQIDPRLPVQRGLQEELGLALPDQVTPVLHQLFVAAPGALAAAVHVPLGGAGVNADDVHKSHAAADDGWELETLQVVECTPDAVTELEGEWVPWAPHCFTSMFALLESTAASACRSQRRAGDAA